MERGILGFYSGPLSKRSWVKSLDTYLGWDYFYGPWAYRKLRCKAAQSCQKCSRPSHTWLRVFAVYWYPGRSGRNRPAGRPPWSCLKWATASGSFTPSAEWSRQNSTKAYQSLAMCSGLTSRLEIRQIWHCFWRDFMENSVLGKM